MKRTFFWFPIGSNRAVIEVDENVEKPESSKIISGFSEVFGGDPAVKPHWTGGVVPQELSFTRESDEPLREDAETSDKFPGMFFWLKGR